MVWDRAMFHNYASLFSSRAWDTDTEGKKPDSQSFDLTRDFIIV